MVSWPGSRRRASASGPPTTAIPWEAGCSRAYRSTRSASSTSAAKLCPLEGDRQRGAHQKNYGGGGEDAILVRFNLDGTRAWGTFYGGTMQEHDVTVAALPQGGVVLSGYTISKNNIATPGSHKPEGDGSDGFVARFGAAGNRVWGTYYGHGGSLSVGRVGVDAVGSIYLCGHTIRPTNTAPRTGSCRPAKATATPTSPS
ncbi:hypothetical protein [Nannocystis pusilla]|uniref:hypothetical protein n=1 Tax=Nannocystis pusilla TaxID=889268 RepID=UPI003B787E1F